MNDFMDTAMMLGFFAGFIAVIIVLIIIRKKNPSSVAQYDERQKAIQGVGYKYGFFSMIILSLFASILYDTLKTKGLWADMFTLEIGAMMVSVLIFAGYSIFNDAYIGFNQKSTKIIITFGVIFVINLVIAYLNIFFDDSSIKESLNTAIVNLMCAVLMIIVIIMIVIKQITNKKADKE